MDDIQIILYLAAILVCCISVYSILSFVQTLCPLGEERVCIRDGESHISCFCVKNIIGGD